MNGAKRSFEGPPSTLPANLVNNLSTRRPSRNAEQEDLSLLAEDVSRWDTELHGNISADDLHELGHKRIYIFVRVCLDPLVTDKPFTVSEEAIERGSDGLSEVLKVISEIPTVLIHIAGPGSGLQYGADAPLWIWLFPRLLVLIGPQPYESLQKQIHTLFQEVFRLASYSPLLWGFHYLFFCYLQNCAENTLNRLRDPHLLLDIKHHDALGLKLPLASIDGSVRLSDGQCLAIYDCTYDLDGVENFMQHVSYLLSILTQACSAFIVPHIASVAPQRFMSWILDSFSALQIMERTYVDLASMKDFRSQRTWRASESTHLLLNSSLPTNSLKRKTYRQLASFCVEIAGNPPSTIDDGQLITFCKQLITLARGCLEFEVVSQTVSSLLVPTLKQFLSGLKEGSTDYPDIKNTISLLEAKCVDPASQICPHFSNPILSNQLALAGLGDVLDPLSRPSLDTIRSSKRRKIDETNKLLAEIIYKLYDLLDFDGPEDFEGIGDMASSRYANLNSFDQGYFLRLLTMIPCASSRSLTISFDNNGIICDAACFICDSTQVGSLGEPVHDETVTREMISTLTRITEIPEFEQSPQARVLGMIVLRSIAVHFNDIELLNLETSKLGQWCLRSLHSSLRELRIAAGRALPAFLRKTVNSDVSESNKSLAFQVLCSVAENGLPNLIETTILAWGQIGRVSSDQELNFALLRLVVLLGHPNQFASSVAFNEILHLSESCQLPIERLFNPFWRNVGHFVVKDLQIRPQITQLTADLFGKSVKDILLMTQCFTLPWLVMTENKDIITRISQARGEQDSWRVILDPGNLGQIIALLLVQSVPDMDAYVMNLLRSISPHFATLDLDDLIRMTPISIAIELLEKAGEADESKRSRIRHALQFLATRAYSGNDSKGKGQLGPFLEQHVLPMVAHFSELVNDLVGWQSGITKRRALKALDEMIRLGQSYLRTALTQICTCLQAALANEETRSTAIVTWKTMITRLDDEEVGNILEITFSTILLRWKLFDDAARQSAVDIISHILQDRHQLIRKFQSQIPSLNGISELEPQKQIVKRLTDPPIPQQQYRIFVRRLKQNNEAIVTQALVELSNYLRENQGFLQASTVSVQPDIVVGELVRSVLDACIKFARDNTEIARLSATCLGLIGCLDSNRVEAPRQRKDFVVVSNFEDTDEVTDFVLFILEHVLLKAFFSVVNTRTIGFLQYAMQQLLEIVDLKILCRGQFKLQELPEKDPHYDLFQKWIGLPELVRQTLTPFTNSKFSLKKMDRPEITYPIFQQEKRYGSWLRTFVLDLLMQPHTNLSEMVFAPLCRVIKIDESSIADFLLPTLVLHTVALGTDEQRQRIKQELLQILSQKPTESHSERTTLRLCSEAVFRVLDYMSRWAQERQTRVVVQRRRDPKWTEPEDESLPTDLGVKRVMNLLSAISPVVISRRAVECKSYARALFHWEQHIRQQRKILPKVDENVLLERLQDIYTQIDEPDGIEGISAHLHVLDIDQQILGHRKAGRWTTAQGWYEIKLAEDPNNVEVQVDLLHCLKESGQHDVLLNYVEGMHRPGFASQKVLPFATEASWATGRWDSLQKYLSQAPKETGGDFNISVGRTLLALHEGDIETFETSIEKVREHLASSLSVSATSSLRTCHDSVLKFHVLTEIEMIGRSYASDFNRQKILKALDLRIESMGSYVNDKQYLLGIRRAAMQLSSSAFSKEDVAASWLTSAKLARKDNALHQSFNAVLHASKLGDESAMIEHARLLWKEGHHRKAIQNLQGAIKTNAFDAHNRDLLEDSAVITSETPSSQQNLLTARAYLLLAKWQDSAGQTHTTALRQQYQLAVSKYRLWEKGHYYLGRHYNKLLESEKGLLIEQQAQSFITGEMAKLVIENYIRSLGYGTKYIYQTLPRILTLWLDLGTQVMQPIDPKYGTKEFMTKLAALRKDQLQAIHARFTKYITKMPAYVFYTALPQIVARIAHPNTEVFKYLQHIIVRVVSSHPQQALWSLLAVSISTQPERKTRGVAILATLRNGARKSDSYDMKAFIKNGERLSDALVVVSNAGDFQGNRTLYVQLTKDLGFHSRCSPSPLAVPIESTLTATLPTLTHNNKTHKAFSRDVVTIDSFEEEVMILSSLQKPRKLTVRGSDGKAYGLLCKPKDDLRKDQRLMEFNSMINRSLKKDTESSKRQLYIKTYAVTPLNEECGIIEWVDGLKTLREILLNQYKVRDISPNYAEIKIYLDEACKADDKLPLFTHKLLGMFPPVFHSWFVEQFAEPSAWFAARLKYTRSCAVMSMIGTILGLGDRHGENILFEEGNGGTFHVDFNCLFDKGLTFAQPERVPFRLTHNMVDAMGVYGYEGPFRKSAELTLTLLRQHEDTLMTILEAFVYDPTLDLLAKSKKKREADRSAKIPDTAQGVLDSIRRKVRGFLLGESVPLGVEGQVDELIKMAVNPKHLAAMYIGWCAFF